MCSNLVGLICDYVFGGGCVVIYMLRSPNLFIINTGVAETMYRCVFLNIVLFIHQCYAILHWMFSMLNMVCFWVARKFNLIVSTMSAI